MEDHKVVELTVGVLEVLKMLKNLETPLGGSMENSARTCKEIMQLNSSLPDGKYWLDPNGGCTEDAFQAECRFSEGGQTCLHPSKQHDDNLRDAAEFLYDASATQFKFLRLLSKEGVQHVSHECLNFKNDLSISSFNGNKIDVEHHHCKHGHKQVHSVRKKEFLPLKDIATTNNLPIRFSLGPVCFH